MTTTFRLVCRSALLLCMVAVSSPALADQGKELFAKHCASCHTIGGGDSGGPDLKGVTAREPAAWLERIISEPDRLTADKDPTQAGLVKKYGFEMPNLGISRDDARRIIAYLGGEAAPAATSADSGAPQASGQAPSPKEEAASPELIAMGKALFEGSRSFGKGGAPCAACHAFDAAGIRGGNLAVDLTHLYEGMGDQGMKGVLTALSFPIMKKAYGDKPLTDGEVKALIAFARDAAGRQPTPSGNGTGAAGALTFVGIIIGLTLYKRRIG
ncbi:MAG TPA: c-type cytochrome [Desulfuromonadaceae bacterium]